ncbi:MAG: 2-oxo acid dehydrogenase subunit E2 [Phycisphaerales bacterium]|nr:2-oxo acid dehydrogenase subunit E2 [Planctomycetota bacterium]MCH8507678.1 2-oxo acid dehydrogenase subunit E2 [Phycisphaerales bacterium]
MAGKVSSDPNIFILPDLGEGLEEAELIAWKVAEGDTVEEHQIIAEMETDKALVEVPSPRAGTIATLHGQDGDIIKVGAPFVTYQGDGAAPAKTKPAPTVKERPTVTKSAEAEIEQADREDAGTVVGKMGDSLAGMSSKDGKALAAPAVRRLARDLGVDIDSVPGTGIGGRVTANDVRNAAEGKTPAKPAPASKQAPSVSERASSPAPAQGAPASRPAETRRPLPSTPIAPRYNPAPNYQPQQHHQQPYQQPQHYPQQPYPYPPQPYGQPYAYPYPAPMPYYAPYPPPMPAYPYPPQHQQGPGIPAAPGYHPTIGSRPIPDPAQRSAINPGQDTAQTPFRGVRRTIANKLRESVSTAVHFTVVDEADVTTLDDYRRQLTEQTGVKLSLLPFVGVAVCRALAGRFGALNARVDDQNEEIVQHAAVHLGIATDTDSGLMVPVIQGADRMDAVTLAQQIAQTAASARDRSISRDRLTGSTFTISNVGSHAGKFATPVINYPEVAILAVGKAYDAVLVRDGQAVIGKALPLSLACDHRVVDGATAALCLAEIVSMLQDPASLV